MRSAGDRIQIFILDFALYGIIFSIIGARIYYVFFQWAYYKDHLMEIVNLRKGGLAIYGGVIAGILTLLVFTKKRHLSFLSMADSACLGLITGQMIGRWVTLSTARPSAATQTACLPCGSDAAL